MNPGYICCMFIPVSSSLCSTFPFMLTGKCSLKVFFRIRSTRHCNYTMLNRFNFHFLSPKLQLLSITSQVILLVFWCSPLGCIADFFFQSLVPVIKRNLKIKTLKKLNCFKVQMDVLLASIKLIKILATSLILLLLEMQQISCFLKRELL